MLVADDIATGRLVAPFPQYRLKPERGYDLVYHTGSQDTPKVKALREWLSDDMR
ncbi:TPA: hypothetical protein MYQ41_003509 [Citrobacter amalonaticus]|nr:hypothetical protein [Citrobacter amalonaticus]HCB1890323.1 hypothetical protein [Citrobacter amalonaticus]HCB1912278.1 hypothetical protein [Citrobacter amalonaticus]